MPRTALSICCGLRGGSTEIVGASSGTAPERRSAADSEPACCRVRGTSTRQPKSGLVSNQDRAARCSTTSPTTATTGAGSFAARTSPATRSSVETTVCCSTVLPDVITATGVVAAVPASISALATWPRWSSARVSTSVSAVHAAQSTLPVTSMTCTLRLRPAVSGPPACAGIAVTPATPGTTSNGTPALAHTRASSAPVGCTNGSPSSSRTTARPPLAAESASLPRTAAVSGKPSSSTPPSTTSTSSAAWTSRSRWCGSSMMTTSASARTSAARSVSSPGSPGPAPTKATLPPLGRFLVVTERSPVPAPGHGRRRALLGHRGTSLGVVECTQDVEHVIVRATLDRERALPGGRQHLQRVEDLGGIVEPAEPGKPGPGDYDGVERAVGHPGQPAVDVPADGHHVQAQAERPELRSPSRRTRADARTHRELREGEPVTGAENVARVLPRWNGGDRQVVLRRRRKVLEGVHGQVDPVSEQGITQGADEDTGTADPGERLGGDVSAGGDLDQLGPPPGRGHDRLGDTARLCQGERAAAGPQLEGRHRAPPPPSSSPWSCSFCATLAASTDRGSRANSSRNAASYDAPSGSTASSFTRTVGEWSNLSTTRRTVDVTSDRVRSSRSGSRPLIRTSSDATPSSAIVRNATTVGATRACCRAAAKPANSSARIERTAATSSAAAVAATALSATDARSAATTPGSSWTAASTSRGRAKSRMRNGRPFRPATAASTISYGKTTPEAPVQDTTRSAVTRAAGSSLMGTAWPPTAFASRAACSSVRLATTISAPARCSFAVASAAIDPAPTTSAVRPVTPSGATAARPTVTTDRPAESIAVSACARFPTRSAVGNSSPSTRPVAQEAWASRKASRTWPRIWLSPTTIESSP